MVDDLIAQQDYSWDQLGDYFGFKAAYFGAAGGMITSRTKNKLLIITHPGGARSFDYQDYWEGNDLIYTGKGQEGDQEYAAQNRDLGENAREVMVFEPAGSYRLRFLGSARCIEHWWHSGPDRTGRTRRILRFRVRMAGSEAPAATNILTAQEGALRLKAHKLRERDKAIAAAAKSAWRAADPGLRCEACDFSFATTYGDWGDGYVEAHHRVPLSLLPVGETFNTTVADLAPVCGNCHRMLHRPPYPSIASLRARITSRR